MARPSKYESHVLPRLEEIGDWVRNGASDREVALRLGISADSLIEYKKQYSEFSECLKNTRAYVDGKVENALLDRALHGDTTAMIFWLKNRRPKEWRDKTTVEANISGENLFAGLSEKELRALAESNGTTATDDSG